MLRYYSNGNLYSKIEHLIKDYEVLRDDLIYSGIHDVMWSYFGKFT